MTTTTETIDSDVLAVAREIYGNRQNQKFGGNRRWQLLKSEMPALAEAAKPPRNNSPQTQTARDEWDAYRDDEGESHKLFESWARSQTAARSPYYYRGGRASVLTDAAGSSPKWCIPYGCWHHTDRGRWVKTSGAGADDTGADAGDEFTRSLYADYTDRTAPTHKVQGRDLRTLHAETNGSYTVEGDGTSDNQLEVCRLCGKSLELPRGERGKVLRSRGGQPEYCSARCKLDVYDARRRAQRRANRPEPQPKRFDLAAVYVSGAGKLEVPPSEWNRMSRSRRASIEEQLRTGHTSENRVPLNLPYLHRRPRSTGITAEELNEVLQDQPTRGWVAGLSPDSIARRWVGWQSFWASTGVAPRNTLRTQPLPPKRRDYQVTQSWRYVERAAVTGEIRQESKTVWRISHAAVDKYGYANT